MSLLIVAATTSEIEPLLKDLRKRKTLPDIDVLITGAGLLAATWSITRQVQLKKPTFIIQAGLAGSLSTSLKPGTVVTVRDEIVADLGVMQEGSFHTLFDLGLAEADAHPYRKGKLVNTNRLITQLSYPAVRAITVNEITTDPSRTNYYRKQLKAAIESMEGAALHYIGLMEKIPFLQLRAISNYIGERDKSKWKMQPAIRKLNKALIDLLKIKGNLSR